MLQGEDCSRGKGVDTELDQLSKACRATPYSKLYMLPDRPWPKGISEFGAQWWKERPLSPVPKKIGQFLLIVCLSGDSEPPILYCRARNELLVISPSACQLQMKKKKKEFITLICMPSLIQIEELHKTFYYKFPAFEFLILTSLSVGSSMSSNNCF